MWLPSLLGSTKEAQDLTNLLSLWLHVMVLEPMETRSYLLGVNEFVWETCGNQYDPLHPFIAISHFPGADTKQFVLPSMLQLSLFLKKKKTNSKGKK